MRFLLAALFVATLVLSFAQGDPLNNPHDNAMTKEHFLEKVHSDHSKRNIPGPFLVEEDLVSDSQEGKRHNGPNVKRYPQTRREWIRNFISLIAYVGGPRPDYPSVDQEVLQSILSDISSSGILQDVTTGFAGNYANNSVADRIGVQYGVWVNNVANTVTVIFPGSYSDHDWTQNFLMWGKALVYDQAQNSLDAWKKFRLSSDDITPVPIEVAELAVAGLKYVWPYRREWFIQTFMATTGFSRAVTISKGYVQLAINIVEQVRVQYPNHELKLTGQSLGGGIASMVALEMAKSHNLSVDTAVFGAPNPRCTSYWKGFGYGTTHATFPQITNYRSIYDPVPVTDWGVGNECYRTGILEGGYDSCASLVGVEGATMAVITTYSDEYDECLAATHRITRVADELFRNSVLREDGTTKRGCVALPQKACPIQYDNIDSAFW